MILLIEFLKLISRALDCKINKLIHAVQKEQIKHDYTFVEFVSCNKFDIHNLSYSHLRILNRNLYHLMLQDQLFSIYDKDTIETLYNLIENELENYMSA